jgi:hypothetical protein
LASASEDGVLRMWDMAPDTAADLDRRLRGNEPYQRRLREP